MQSPIPNRFRQRILARERLIGLWVSLASHVSTEIVGLANFDWLLIDSEHSPNDIPLMMQQLQVLQASPSAVIARAGWNDPVEIKRLLDIGFYNLLIPFVESEEEARRAVAATRYPPAGTRGVALAQRGSNYGTVPDYHKHINDHICVLVQIESRKGLDALDDIAAVDGVDGIFIGPSDLSAALGHLGDSEHPEVQATIRDITARATAKGKAVGIIAPDNAIARRYIDMGMHFVAVGSDQGCLQKSLVELRQKFAV